MEKCTKLHRGGKPLTDLGICWQKNLLAGKSKEEGLQTLSQQASEEQLKSMSRQLVIEVHVAVALSMDMSRTERLARTGAFEQRAEPSHQVI